MPKQHTTTTHNNAKNNAQQPHYIGTRSITTTHNNAKNNAKNAKKMPKTMPKTTQTKTETEAESLKFVSGSFVFVCIMLLAATPHFLIDVVGCHLVFFPYDVVGYHVFFFCTIMLIHGGRAIMLILV